MVIVNQTTRRRNYFGLPIALGYSLPSPTGVPPVFLFLLSSSSSPVASSLPVHFSVLLWPPTQTNSLPSFLPSVIHFLLHIFLPKLHRPTSLPAFPPFHRLTASFYFLPHFPSPSSHTSAFHILLLPTGFILAPHTPIFFSILSPTCYPFASHPFPLPTNTFPPLSLSHW